MVKRCGRQKVDKFNSPYDTLQFELNRIECGRKSLNRGIDQTDYRNHND